MTAAEAMDRVVAVALLGARGDVASIGAPARVEALGAGRSGAEQALAMAAGLSQYVRAGGAALSGGAERVAGPAPEQAKVARPGAAAALRRALETKELLPECLRELAGRRVVAPPAMLPALLELGSRSPRVAAQVAPVLGERGRWLAAFDSRWRQAQAAAGPDPATSAARWQTGERDERLLILAPLRASDPAAARALVESTWSEDSPEERARFLQRLKTGLGPDDEPLLERALADRRKQVREIAADLLARLPESAYVQRMTMHALDAVVRAPGRKLRLELALPAEDDAELKRAAPPVPDRPGRGERARLLEAIVGAARPAAWREKLEAQPAEIVRAMAATEWGEALICGLVKAVVRQGDLDWAEALLESHSKMRWSAPAEEAAELASLLSATGRTLAVVTALKGSKDSTTVSLLLAAIEGQWDSDISAAAAEVMTDVLRRAKGLRLYRDHPEWRAARTTALHIGAANLKSIRPFIEAVAETSPAFIDILSLLDQREQMLEELSRDD